MHCVYSLMFFPSSFLAIKLFVWCRKLSVYTNPTLLHQLYIHSFIITKVHLLVISQVRFSDRCKLYWSKGSVFSSLDINPVKLIYKLLSLVLLSSRIILGSPFHHSYTHYNFKCIIMCLFFSRVSHIRSGPFPKERVMCLWMFAVSLGSFLRCL